MIWRSYMAYKPTRPIFRQTDEDIERKVNQRLDEQTRSLKEEITGKIEERTKPLEEIAKSFQEDREEKLREKQERELQERVNKLADERADKLADERADKLADERADKLADERADKLADKRADKLADERADKLADERAKRIAEEMATKLADEKAKTLAEEMAVKLANEKAVKLAEEMSIKLTEEKLKQLNDEKTKQLALPTPSATVAITAQTPQAPPVQTSSPDTSSKIAKMIEEIKKRKAAIPPPSPVSLQPDGHVHTQIPIISPDQAVDDGIACPTCHKGHVHSVETDGVTYKCTGPDCGKEYVMVDKTADYKCVNCGVPIKRPEDDKLTIDSCPFCKGKKAVKFDWGKVWKIQKPVMGVKK